MDIQLSEIFKLSVAERVLLVEAIWDSIVSEKESAKTYELSQEQIHFLEEELKAYSQNPTEGSSWEDIKKRILKK